MLFVLTDVSSSQPVGFAGPPNRLVVLPPPNVNAASLGSSSSGVASSRGAIQQQMTFSHLSSGLATIQSSPQSSGQSSIQQPVWMMPECQQGPGGVFKGQPANLQKQPQPELWLHGTNEPVAVQQVLSLPQQMYKIQPASEQTTVLEVQQKPAVRTNHRLFPTETDTKSKQSLPIAAVDSSLSADVAPEIAPICWQQNPADCEEGSSPVRPSADGRNDLTSGSFCPPIPDFIPRDSAVHRNDAASDYVARNASQSNASQECHSSDGHDGVLETSSQEVGSTALFFFSFHVYCNVWSGTLLKSSCCHISSSRRATQEIIS